MSSKRLSKSQSSVLSRIRASTWTCIQSICNFWTSARWWMIPSHKDCMTTCGFYKTWINLMISPSIKCSNIRPSTSHTSIFFISISRITSKDQGHSLIFKNLRNPLILSSKISTHRENLSAGTIMNTLMKAILSIANTVRNSILTMMHLWAIWSEKSIKNYNKKVSNSIQKMNRKPEYNLRNKTKKERKIWPSWNSEFSNLEKSSPQWSIPLPHILWSVSFGPNS